MELNGLSMSLFATQQEAFDTADELVRLCEEEFNFKSPVIEVPGHPLLTRRAYIYTEGRERTWSTSDTKKAEQNAKVAPKALADETKCPIAFFGAPSASSGEEVAVSLLKTEKAPQELIDLRKLNVAKRPGRVLTGAVKVNVLDYSHVKTSIC